MNGITISEQDLEDFKTEARELLDAAEKRLLALDAGTDNFADAYDDIFRAFHSLKGAAGMMELTKIQAHTHEMENLLVRTKESGSLSKELITTFLRGVDTARTMIESGDLTGGTAEAPQAPAAPIEFDLPKTEEPKANDIPQSVVDEYLAECDEIVERVSHALQSIEQGSYDAELLNALYRDAHTLKGTSYLFSFELLGDVAHAMESGLETVRAGTHLPSKTLLSCLFKGLGLIDTLLKCVREKKPMGQYKDAVALIGKALALSAEKLPIAPVASVAEEGRAAEATQEAPAHAGDAPKASDGEASGSIRVSVSLLDNLMTLMGEMVLVRNQVLQYSSKSADMEFVSMSKRLNVVTSEIQEEMMKTRMQPIGNILTKFNRVVRDLAQDLKKDINLTVTGAETELDKTLLEAIKDPLTHIVRNSCDHGIEVPEKRRALGKPAAGNITVKSYHEGGQVVIEVGDDGKGLHRDALIQKAIEKGLISAGQKLSDKEAFELIFHPGFSTAAKITNVSGRGVGMDVVRTNIEKIGGTVDLSSVPNHGTTIKIKVPLTLAIIPALIVQSGGSKFAIPQVKLEELVMVDHNSADGHIEYLHGSPVYRLRGNLLPLVELNGVLGLEAQRTDGAPVTIAVLNAESFTFGVIIDEIHDTADIVVKPLNRLLKTLQVYSGGTILGDGTIALIIDVMGLAKHAHLGQEKTQALDAKSEQKGVDDSQNLLLVKVNSPTRHAIDLSYVNRLEVFPASAVETSAGQRVIRYRGGILPLIRANQHLGYAASQNADFLSVIVVNRAGKLFGLEVDGILDSLTTTAELDKSLVKSPCFFGNLNTADGIIVMINPFEVISLEFPEAQQPLPVALARALETTPPDAAEEKRGILLVEDTAFFRKAIKQVLEERDYVVFTANNGEEAIELLKAQAQDIQLIVSDIEMPRMNGFQLAEAVRKQPQLKNLPMLAISSRADKDYRSKGMRAGFDVYLEKLKPPVLLAAVQELLRGKREVA